MRTMVAIVDNSAEKATAPRLAKTWCCNTSAVRKLLEEINNSQRNQKPYSRGCCETGGGGESSKSPHVGYHRVVYLLVCSARCLVWEIVPQPGGIKCEAWEVLGEVS